MSSLGLLATLAAAHACKLRNRPAHPRSHRSCLATNPRKRPSAVEVVERLRAMPDATLPSSAQRALLAPPGAAPGPPLSPAGRPGAAASGTAAARLGAAPPTPQQRQPQQPPAGRAPQRLSSESDASLEAPHTTAELEAAYASPVPGSSTSVAVRIAAARLAAAAGDPVAAMRRSCSVLLGAMPFTLPQRQEERQLAAKELMGRASSSPPGDRLPEPAPLTNLGAPRASPPSRGHRAALRQLSLDDPAKQAAGARAAARYAVAVPILLHGCARRGCLPGQTACRRAARK